MRIFEPADLYRSNRHRRFLSRKYLAAVGGESRAVFKDIVGPTPRLLMILPELCKWKGERSVFLDLARRHRAKIRNIGKLLFYLVQRQLFETAKRGLVKTQ